MSTIERYLQLTFYVLYHHRLSCYYHFFMNPIIRDYHVIMSMGSVAWFSEKVKLIILLMDTATRDSYRSIKALSNRLWKLLKQYEGVNPGHENLKKIMLSCQNLKAYETLFPKLLNKFSNPCRPGIQDY